MQNESFAIRLRKALNTNNMSQTKLSELTKLDKSLISNYLSGTYKPKQDKIFLIASALNVSEAWLMGFDVSSNFNSDNIKQITPEEFSKEVKSLLLKTGNLTDSEKAHLISTLDLICDKH